MNILIFSTAYPAPKKYGVPNDTKVVHYYAQQWTKAGHTVHVIYLHMNPIKHIYKHGNIFKSMGYESDYTIEGIPVHFIEYQLIKPRANYLSDKQAANANERINRYLDNIFVPDKVFVHFPCTFKGIECVTKFNCPTMAVLHNVDMSILKQFPELQDQLRNYSNIGGRNRKICDVAQELLSRNISLVLSGIDESLIPSHEIITNKINRIHDHIKIAYAGNLIKLKKVDVLIKALNNVGFDYQCEIIGDGPEKEKLIACAKGNPKISFRGRLTREETIEAMRAADLFVMVSSPETFGLVYVEAMAQGCVTVGSKGEGIDGVIVNGENGFLVAPDHETELAQCLEYIVAMKADERAKIAFAGYDNATNMTESRMAKNYLQLNI